MPAAPTSLDFATMFPLLLVIGPADCAAPSTSAALTPRTRYTIIRDSETVNIDLAKGEKKALYSHLVFEYFPLLWSFLLLLVLFF